MEEWKACQERGRVSVKVEKVKEQVDKNSRLRQEFERTVCATEGHQLKLSELEARLEQLAAGLQRPQAEQQPSRTELPQPHEHQG